MSSFGVGVTEDPERLLSFGEFMAQEDAAAEAARSDWDSCPLCGWESS